MALPELPTKSAEEIRFGSNYGATSLVANIREQGKQSAMRTQAMQTMVQALAKANQQSLRGMSAAPPIRNRGPGPSMRGPGPKRGGGNVKGNPKFKAFVKAIFGQESGGNYKAVNASSGAAGKYQILPGNFIGRGGWDKEAGLQNVTLQQFMNNPRIQDRIAQHKLRQYVKQYGFRGAAQAWYGGPGAVGNDNISGGTGYPSTGGYADEILHRMRVILNRRR